MNQDHAVFVTDFTGSDAQKVQQAIDHAAINGNPSVVYVPDGDYVITETLILREGVSLIFAYDARFVVYGNQDVLHIEKNAGITGAYIAIDDSRFNRRILVFDGKYKYYNSWNRSRFQQINMVNWSGSHKGTGIYLSSSQPSDEISFLQFDDIKAVGLHTALEVRVTKPSSGYSWVNANNFMNVTIDDCVRGIWMNSSKTIPNEASGNNFTNLQIQLSSISRSAVRVTGDYNYLQGMIWDAYLASQMGDGDLVHLTSNSSHTECRLRGNHSVLDQGTDNTY
ncbi:glycoside hydrolase family 55 protein [Halobacillus litoralis]|uniref:glycoside hydrolase family 55 protein n=1 Tax=Halobacillus litoralis TaxID=45668 RepID=UPI001CD6B5A8|nr:glycoside hydrolase family 55 protein [Halobacillus litoralis]MCA1022018.1 glycoside hydrolase family 55 protein [Halobacillus litoralis]